MKTTLASSFLLASTVALLSLTACEKKEGPMERAGKSVDNAVDKAKDAVNPRGPMEKAGEKVDNAVENAKDATKSKDAEKKY